MGSLGYPLSVNVLPREKQRLLLRCFCRGCGIADAAEIAEISTTTARRYLERFGVAFADMHDRRVRGLHSARLQVDEIWSYVYAKAETVREMPNPPEGAGDVYTWTALDPDTKLFVSWLSGGRGEEYAIPFLADVRMRVAGRPLITTDAHGPYPKAVEINFGSNVDHVVIRKALRSQWDRETGVRKTTVLAMHKEAQNQSKVDLDLASTSLAERHHGTMRNFMSRFTRQTYEFSKKFQNHLHAQAIYAAYYNFSKRHDGFKGPERHYTPAMKAGIATGVMTYGDLLDEVDRYWATVDLIRDASAPPLFQGVVRADAGVAIDAPFFVMHDATKRLAKVHRGECRNCRNGLGRSGGSKTTAWYAVDGGPDQARELAAALAPHDHSDCAICVTGSYRTREQPAR